MMKRASRCDLSLSLPSRRVLYEIPAGVPSGAHHDPCSGVFQPASWTMIYDSSTSDDGSPHDPCESVLRGIHPATSYESTRRCHMGLGPIEILVIEFPGSQFTGEIIPELERLIEKDTISIIDGLLVKKDLNGDVTFVEFDE